MSNNYHDKQIERYLSQVIRAFSVFTVSDGVVRDGSVHTERVPVIFGSPSRVVAAIMSGDAKFRNVKVPLLAVSLSGIERDEEATLNRYHENELSFNTHSTGLRNVARITGVPLRMQVDLHIYASSVSQLMQLFEQIALTFNPEVMIQKSTDVRDSDYITSIRLESISPEITHPLGQQHRATEMTLGFSVPITLSYRPMDQDPLESIRLKVYDEPSSDLNSDDELKDIVESEEVIEG